MSYDNTNKGAVWGNKEKQKDTHPDFKGSLNVDGVEYWVSAWRRSEDASPNSPALKLSIQRKEKAQNPSKGQAKNKTAPPPPENFFDDDIPF